MPRSTKILRCPDDFAGVVAAVNRLNSFVRTTASHRFTNLYSAVYHIKDRVLTACMEYGLTVRRNIWVKANCRSCHGTGMHLWMSGEQNPCWYCNGGKVELFFRETKIGRSLHQPDWPLEDITWHSPTGNGILPTAQLVSDWKPRTPGIELSSDQVAIALNVAEPKWNERGAIYRMFLGAESGPCRFCGGADKDMMMHGVTRGSLGWSANVCGSCQRHHHEIDKRYGYLASVYQHLPFPKQLVTPAIHEWIERHGGMAKVAEISADSGIFA